MLRSLVAPASAGLLASVLKGRRKGEVRRGRRTETVPVVNRTNLDPLLVELVALAAFFTDCIAPASFADLLRSPQLGKAVLGGERSVNNFERKRGREGESRDSATHLQVPLNVMIHHQRLVSPERDLSPKQRPGFERLRFNSVPISGDDGHVWRGTGIVLDVVGAGDDETGGVAGVDEGLEEGRKGRKSVRWLSTKASKERRRTLVYC
jgi:hypothetical protein